MANRHDTHRQKRQTKAKAVEQGLTAYDVIFSGILITGLGLLYGIFYI